MLSSTRSAPWSCAWNREPPTLKAPLVLRGSFECEVNYRQLVHDPRWSPGTGLVTTWAVPANYLGQSALGPQSLHRPTRREGHRGPRIDTISSLPRRRQNESCINEHNGLSALLDRSGMTSAFVSIRYFSSHSNLRGFHPRSRFAFPFDAPLSLVP
jgi:hypothetical protein